MVFGVILKTFDDVRTLIFGHLWLNWFGLDLQTPWTSRTLTQPDIWLCILKNIGFLNKLFFDRVLYNGK